MWERTSGPRLRPNAGSSRRPEGERMRSPHIKMSKLQMQAGSLHHKLTSGAIGVQASGLLISKCPNSRERAQEREFHPSKIRDRFYL